MNTATYLDRREAADYLGRRGLKISWRTLQKFACVGGGPQYVLFGIRALYEPDDLDRWAKSKISKPRTTTSERIVA